MQVLEVHLEGLLRDLGNLLFVQQVQALDLLEENGWQTDWAVHSYTSDLRAAREATAKHPDFHRKLEMMNRILMLGPPDKSEWIRNDDRESCISCKKEFSWSFRRHHCRCCGEVFCDDCSKYQKVLPFVGCNASKTPMRVCTECNRIDWGYTERRFRVDQGLLDANTPPPSGSRPEKMSEQEYRIKFLSKTNSKDLSEIETQATVCPPQYDVPQAPPSYEMQAEFVTGVHAQV